MGQKMDKPKIEVIQQPCNTPIIPLQSDAKNTMLVCPEHHDQEHNLGNKKLRQKGQGSTNHIDPRFFLIRYFVHQGQYHPLNDDKAEYDDGQCFG